MNRQEEQNEVKSAEDIRQGKRARVEKEKQANEKDITNLGKTDNCDERESAGASRLFLKGD